jgi:hypothetical protein
MGGIFQVYSHEGRKMGIETAKNFERSLCLAFHSVKMRKEPRKESGLGIVTDSSYPWRC